MTHPQIDGALAIDTRRPNWARNNLFRNNGRYQSGHYARPRPPVSTALHSPTQNHLLAALPAAELKRLSPHLELVSMPFGEMLYEPGSSSQYAYFPTSAIVSLHYVMQTGASAEFASVASEGIVGIALFMGGNSTPSSAVVQHAGHGYRLAACLLRDECSRAGILQTLLLRYTGSLMAQMAQTAACYRYHAVDQQLCRWLLLTLDRLRSSEVVTTQELVASMLGVRREGITGAVGKLQRAGVITHQRRHIAVLDRSGLEARACECYSVVKTEMLRLLADVQRQRNISADAYGAAPEQLTANRLAWRSLGSTAVLS
jgi:CRP-like cAMP-binding protein